MYKKKKNEDEKLNELHFLFGAFLQYPFGIITINKMLVFDEKLDGNFNYLHFRVREATSGLEIFQEFTSVLALIKNLEDCISIQRIRTKL